MSAGRTSNRMSRPAGRGGFTLAELLVAVAAVLLLTIGIGQLFGNVGALVSTGAAVSEVDQLARAIEDQLRDDFAAMSEMKTEDTLLAIRNRRVGDINRDGNVTSGPGSSDRPVYLTLDDREADEKDGYDPYETRFINGQDVKVGRGVTVRVDDVLFIAFGGQQDAFISTQEAGSGGTLVSAPVARIYYGHGLKPQLQSIPYDSSDPTNSPTYRGRPPLDTTNDVVESDWLADGDFGQPLGETTNRYRPTGAIAGGPTEGRNEFAGEFVLTRQALLLYGGLASGYVGAEREPAIGREREVALLARDGDNLNLDLGGLSLSTIRPFIRPGGAALLPTASTISFGRADICAQSPESLKRWLEGFLEDTSSGTPVQPDATPLDAGFFDQVVDPTVVPTLMMAPHDPDQILWQRNDTGDAQALADNLAGLQSAIAGMFVRTLIESDPPTINRNSETYLDSDPGGARPEDGFMDLYATLASRCSNFEIAWSDGTTWNHPVDALGVDLDQPNPQLRLVSPPDANSDVVYKPGDLIWFDLDVPRRLLAATFPIAYPLTALDPEILPESLASGERNARLFIPLNDGDNLQDWGEYDPYITGGAPDDEEYMAIWGYRRPTEGGDYSVAWVKPRLLRFRMTLHDAQFRLEGGKTFEFIVSIETK